MDNSKEKKKRLREESKLRNRFVVDDKKEVVAQPDWNKDEANQSRIPLSLASLLVPDIKELKSFDVRDARARIDKIVQPNEQIEWVDKFEFKTLQDSIRDGVFIFAVVVVLFIAAPIIVSYLGFSAETIQQMMQQLSSIIPIFVGVMLIFWGLTQLIGRKTFIALTNHRIIVCGAGQNSWIWTIYAEDIHSMDIVDKLGKRVIRIVLTTNRTSFNYIGLVYLNNISDVDLVADRLKTYKDTVKTARQDRFDKPEKITIAKVKAKSKSGLYNFFSIKPQFEIILGLVGLAVSGFLYFSNSSALSWPTAEAVYQNSKVTSKQGVVEKFYVNRIYKYKVSGTKYDFKEEDQAKINSKKEAEKIASEKPIEKLNISYNPKNPSESKLNPGKKLQSALVLALYCAAFAITGLIVKTFLPDETWKNLLIHYLIFATILIIAYQLGTYIKF